MDKHSVSVAGVVLNSKGEILIIQRRDNGQFQIPGGILELDEKVIDGLKREIHEETGIVVEVVCLTGVYKNIPKGVVSLVFKCTYISGKETISDETVDVKWFSSKQIFEKVKGTYIQRIEDSLKFNGFVSIRNHDGNNFF